jgi:hypothetical protein
MIGRLENGEPDYPTILRDRLGDGAPRCLHALGDTAVLRNRSLGLVCSIQCPGSIIIKTFDAIRELRDAAVTVMGGFHSPMERQCLDILLRGSQPVILWTGGRDGRKQVNNSKPSHEQESRSPQDAKRVSNQKGWPDQAFDCAEESMAISLAGLNAPASKTLMDSSDHVLAQHYGFTASFPLSGRRARISPTVSAG